MLLRSCETCGQQFQGHGLSKYCSPECRPKHTYLLPDGTRVTRRGRQQYLRDNGLCIDCAKPIDSKVSRSRCDFHSARAGNSSKGWRA